MSTTHTEKNRRSVFNVREYDNGTHKRHFPSCMNFSCQSNSCINQISAKTSSQDHCFSTVAVFKCLVQTLFPSWLETSQSVTNNIWRIQYTIWRIYDMSSRHQMKTCLFSAAPMEVFVWYVLPIQWIHHMWLSNRSILTTLTTVLAAVNCHMIHTC